MNKGEEKDKRRKEKRMEMIGEKKRKMLRKVKESR
jgi:hypothetical protein